MRDSISKIDSLLGKLSSVYESALPSQPFVDEELVDWRATQRFTSWICGHAQNALAGAKVKDEEKTNQELGRCLLMLTHALAALGHHAESRDLMNVAKKLQSVQVAEAEFDETSLSRVYRHFKEGEFGIVSAFRKELPDEENMARQFNLGQDIRRLRLGFIPVLGKWSGDNERALFVPQISKKQVLALGARYDQDSVIHGEKGTAEEILKNGDVRNVFKDFRVLSFDTDKEFDNYSALRSKSGKPHQTFRRQGQDILCDVPVHIITAILGGKLEVPTLKGNTIIKVPAGTQQDKTLRLKGLGIRHVNASGRGDLFVHLDVRVPQKLTKEQRRLLEQLREILPVENEPAEKGILDKVRDYFT